MRRETLGTNKTVLELSCCWGAPTEREASWGTSPTHTKHHLTGKSSGITISF